MEWFNKQTLSASFDETQGFYFCIVFAVYSIFSIPTRSIR